MLAHAYLKCLRTHQSMKIRNGKAQKVIEAEFNHRVQHQPHRRSRGGSNEYPQSMFLKRNKKNNVYPCKPQFYYIKVGFKGVKII